MVTGTNALANKSREEMKKIMKIIEYYLTRFQNRMIMFTVYTVNIIYTWRQK
jgi:hypothetical protein